MIMIHQGKDFKNSMLFLLFSSCVAMATRDTTPTKRHIPKLQSSIELHKPSIEPKPSRVKKKESNTSNELGLRILHARELEKDLGFILMDHDHDRIVLVEILPIQAKRCVSCDGLLFTHSKRSS